MQSTWRSRIRIVALVGGLCLTDYGFVFTPAIAAPPVKEDALAGVTQNWDKVLPAAQRFVILAVFNNEAVRDNETGLVWERSPATTTQIWGNARGECTSRTTGGRRGWRLPSVVELLSLMDLSLPAPFVPSSIFSGVQSALYWTATTWAVDPTGAWIVDFSGGPSPFDNKTITHFVWCVRGPMNADAY
jgi:hypothetical protein